MSLLFDPDWPNISVEVVLLIASPQVPQSRFGSFEVLYSINFASWFSTWNAKSEEEDEVELERAKTFRAWTLIW